MRDDGVADHDVLRDSWTRQIGLQGTYHVMEGPHQVSDLVVPIPCFFQITELFVFEQICLEFTSAHARRQSREFLAPVENARTAVTKRINIALKAIEGEHTELGKHLTNSINTGRSCCYRPEQKLLWELF